MNSNKHKSLMAGIVGTSAIALSTLFSQTVLADAITDAITAGKASLDIHIRYEDVELGDNDSDSLTMRTLLSYTTGSYEGFSATVAVEDVRDVLGIDDENGLIPETENTEVDQAFIQYKNDMLTAKVGRQILTYDGHRHVGHVGWRQDWQTFDAARLTLTPMKDLSVDLSYIYKVNRINSPTFDDVDSPDHTLLNISYKTPFGKLVGYGYSLSQEGGFDATDTYGVSFTGSTGEDVKFLYALEFATQDNETADVDTDYSLVELGVSAAGFTAKITNEVLGSDDGIENFQTPLATVHKFQGWADVFLGGSLFGTIAGGNGIDDTYITLSTKKFGGVNLLAVYHEYESDEGSLDYGDEFNFQATKAFTKNYSGGIKYADYSADDFGSDKEILWVWVGAKY